MGLLLQVKKEVPVPLIQTLFPVFVYLICVAMSSQGARPFDQSVL